MTFEQEAMMRLECLKLVVESTDHHGDVAKIVENFKVIYKLVESGV